MPPVVQKLHDDLCVNYEAGRLRPCEVEWPPNQPSSFVNLALIHYQNRRTQEEIIEISKRCKAGASHIDELAASHFNVTKDIQAMFMPELEYSNKLPQRIIIEGAPGIGKTVLAKEIVYQWANGKVLQNYELVFLLYLRDPVLHKLKSIDDIFKLFISEDTEDLIRYVKKCNGKNIAFVIDGFDEYPVKLQKQSCMKDLITGQAYSAEFNECGIVVTSRPTATLFLHNIVDRRIEILGLPKEERERYVSLSLKSSFSKIQTFNNYLKRHPIIDNLCYIPLHLAILMFLFFHQNKLPETLTEMNELFIINTIYRYLDRNNLTPPGVVKRLRDFPNNIVGFIYKLSQLAFEGLQKNQLVFPLEQVKYVCPEVDIIPGGINGFGLLQAVQHYPETGAGRATSLNFLHFTMQEYLAAFHVSTTLSSEKQSSLMENTFWDGQFNFMWMMYVGIVGVKSNTFTSFISYSECTYSSPSKGYLYRYTSDSVYADKRKCLHLFQCYMEAKSNAEMPEAVSSIFTEGTIMLDDITLLPHHISSLIYFMSASSKQKWKRFSLGGCGLDHMALNSLLQHVIKYKENISTLEYVDLSGNRSNPWDVYCAIIKFCCVKSLTLCGNEEMNKYFQGIKDSLQINETLDLLTLHVYRETDMGKGRYNHNTKMVLSTTVLNGKLYFNTQVNDKKLLVSDERAVNVKILYDSYQYFETLPEIINFSNSNINKDTVCLIAFGLCNNKLVKKLDLSSNNISDDEIVILSDCLKRNNTLQKLNIAKNKITDDGAMLISEWLKHNNTLQKLNISQNKIVDYGAIAFANSLKHNTTLRKLRLSYNDINLRGMNTLSQFFIQYATSLSYVDLRGNRSSPWNVYCAIIRHCCVIRLTLCVDDRMKEYINKITESLQINTILQSLTLLNMGRIMSVEYIELNISWMTKCTKIVCKRKYPKFNNAKLNSKVIEFNIECSSDNISNEGINDDAVFFGLFGLHKNTAIQKINFSKNNITDMGTVNLSGYLESYHPFKELKLSGMNNLSQHINDVMVLTYVDLSGNISSPWGIYSAIITHCCVTNLVLFGDEGMPEYVESIREGMQKNVMLKSLTLCEVGRPGISVIESILVNNSTLKDLNLSWGNNAEGTKIMKRPLKPASYSDNEVCVNILYNDYHEILPKTIDLSKHNIDDDAACVITFGLYNNTIVEELDLSLNVITNEAVEFFNDCLKYNNTLLNLDISFNKLTANGAMAIGNCLRYNKTLQKLTAIYHPKSY